MKSIGFDKIALDGFWKERFEINKNSTIPMVYNRFCDTGRFDAFRCDWKEGMENKPHFFWDSDVAKWIEGAAYTIKICPDANLEKIIDETVDLIEKNQWDDGYFNIYFTVIEPEGRFKNRDCHELYCAGHLMEAAVAYYEATGKDKFLKIMCRYADLIEKVFVKEKSAAFSTPGHEEIELALIKLYNCTGEVRYLELSRHFLESRGRCENDTNCRDWCEDDYDQSQSPIRELPAPIGHSVRACYLYCGMADLARETNDKSLFDACERLFDRISQKRMYITGGIGSAYHGEKFTEDYDLPNDLAYCETCASIALAMFAKRMSLIKPDRKYDDVAERAIYNCILSGVSLDGNSFFYVNPLEINRNRFRLNTTYRKANEHLLTHRIEVFTCSCCPPNVVRFFASIGDYGYTADENTIYVHQFISGKADIEGVKINLVTKYPHEGTMNFAVKNGKGKTLAVRIPGWCDDFKFGGIDYELKENGYAYIDITDDDIEFSLELAMEPTLVSANPETDADLGKAALCVGPLVYCAESIDNGNLPLNMYSFALPLETKKYFNKDKGYYEISAKAFLEKESDMLYKKLDAESKKEVSLKLIPYYAFANREESDMLIWFRY